MINDQPAHHTRGISHEMRVVGKRRTGMRDHVEIGVVQNRSDTQDSWTPQTPQFAFRKPAQVGVQGAEQCIGGCLLTGSNCSGERVRYAIHGVPSCEETPKAEGTENSASSGKS